MSDNIENEVKAEATAKQTKLKKIIFPAAILALCAVIIVVTLFALKGKGGGESSHIVIDNGGMQTVEGGLDIKLVRENLETLTLDDRGRAVRNTYESVVDFTHSDKNIFGIDGNILIGPGSYFSADMVISNLLSGNFEYWLEIVPQGGKNLLAEQLEITVDVGGSQLVRRTLSGGLQTVTLARVEDGNESRFTARLEYITCDNNNETKDTTLAFDMKVHAREVK